MVVDRIEAGEFAAFADALRFVCALSNRGIRLAAASSSNNAGLLLGQIWLGDDRTGRVCGCAIASTGMAPLGVARARDAELLAAAGAGLVVTTLDDVALDRLTEGRLSSLPA